MGENSRGLFCTHVSPARPSRGQHVSPENHSLLVRIARAPHSGQRTDSPSRREKVSTSSHQKHAHRTEGDVGGSIFPFDSLAGRASKATRAAASVFPLPGTGSNGGRPFRLTDFPRGCGLSMCSGTFSEALLPWRVRAPDVSDHLHQKGVSFTEAPFFSRGWCPPHVTARPSSISRSAYAPQKRRPSSSRFKG